MKYKAKVKIFNDLEDKFLDKGDVFEVKTVHIRQGVAWVHIVHPADGNERERPENITTDVLDRFCEVVKEVKKDAKSTKK